MENCAVVASREERGCTMRSGWRSKPKILGQILESAHYSGWPGIRGRTDKYLEAAMSKNVFRGTCVFGIAVIAVCLFMMASSLTGHASGPGTSAGTASAQQSQPPQDANAPAVPGGLGYYLEGRRSLYVLDDAYMRWPLPANDQTYAGIEGKHIKDYVNEITAISRQSRDDGNQYWGRIAGTKYDIGNPSSG